MRDYKFGRVLQEVRIQKGLSQYQLGALVGVSGKAVSKWENGVSKPAHRTLAALCEVLDITADTLLHGYEENEEEENTGNIFNIHARFGQNALQMRREKYGDLPDLRILNRWHSESRELNGRMDWQRVISYVGRLRKEAAGTGELVLLRGNFAGGSLIAYVMGMTDINPLPPHYYCPDCCRTEFCDTVFCGWDLPVKHCDCGREYVRDGHNIPISIAKVRFQDTIALDMCSSVNYYPVMKEKLMTYFSADYTVAILRKEQPFSRECLLLLPKGCSGIVSGQPVTMEEYRKKYIGYPVILLKEDKNADLLSRLQKETNTAVIRLPLLSLDNVQEMLAGTYGGVPNCGNYYSGILQEVRPASVNDLIRFHGFGHGVGVWTENAQLLLQNGMLPEKPIAFLEDVVMYVQERMNKAGLTDTGWAETIMLKTKNGKYALAGMPESVKTRLVSIGAEPWFIESIEKIRYLHPKSLGVLDVWTALAFIWYKRNMPEVFDPIYQEYNGKTF